MTDQDFVKASVSIQLGQIPDVIGQSREALERALSACSGGSLAYLPGEKNFIVYSREQGLHEYDRAALNPATKAGAAMAKILAQNPEFGFVVDMQDRRVKQIANAGEAPFPVFSFNRVAGKSQRILVPLAGYSEIGCGQFVDAVHPGAVDWKDKAACVVWRGNTGGRVMASSPNGLDEGMRMKTILRQLGRYPDRREEFEAAARRVTRHHAVTFVADDPRFDWAFVDKPGAVVSKMPFHEHLVRPRMTPLEMQQYRYIAVLRGMDVGSNFYWLMNSGSVGFVMEIPFESFASPLFKPWEHYIPFREDCSDLVERFEWAEANPDACLEMVSRSTELCALLARADLSDAIWALMIKRLNQLKRTGTSSAPKLQTQEGEGVPALS